MKLLILKDSRIVAKAGEIVEVSPAEANFLMSTGSAIPVVEKAGKTVETPEGAQEIETAEAPKKARTTRKK